jgi:Domain of unknown function (DUF3883)
MSGSDWSRAEVEAIVEDYLEMLGRELAGVGCSKTAHRRALMSRLDERSESSVEFKHGNISAALLDLGFPYIAGYKCRTNYQALLAEVLAAKLPAKSTLLEIAAMDADRTMVVPEVEDILSVLSEKPEAANSHRSVREPADLGIRLPTNYIEREARNRSLGDAGELFALNYERARLIHAGQERLAAKIEHTSRVRGDHEGYDVLSFEENGAERLIEVKTIKYGVETPFYVTRNELAVSEKQASRYQVYRLFAFRKLPRLYTLPGAIRESCLLAAATFLAQAR